MNKFLVLPLFIMYFAGSTPGFNNSQEIILPQPSTFCSDVISETCHEVPVQKIELSTGVTVDYVEKGNTAGTPVIFLHGLTDSWRSYEKVFELLPASIHGFAISQRGHGDSDKPLNGYSPNNFAADLAAFIQQKGLPKVVVVGHSMGGVIAQQFALTYPDLIKGLVIVGSDPSFQKNPGIPAFHQEVMQLGDTLSYEFMDAFQGSTLAKPLDDTFYQTIVKEGLKVPARVLKAALTGILQANFISQLRNLKCPTLILWGDKDSVCGKKGQNLMDKNIPHSTLKIYKGTGHALHWEEPNQFTNDLLHFLRSEKLIVTDTL